jgi:uncharacterized protein (DUF1697 family)
VATWVALLRAVNVGGRNPVPMAELRRVLEDAGYADVRTVIQSGNVVFAHPKPSAAEIEALIDAAFGVRPTVVLRSARQLRALAESHPFGADTSHTHVAFLARKPRAAALHALDGLDRYELVGSDLALHFPDGYAAAQLTGAVVEKRLGIEATVRNWRTVQRLADLVG